MPQKLRVAGEKVDARASGPFIVDEEGREVAIVLAGDGRSTERARLFALAPFLLDLVREEWELYGRFRTLPIGYPPERAQTILRTLQELKGGA